MSLFDGAQSLADLALLAGLSATRMAVAFMILPIFSQETVPALVRNAIFLSLGLLAMALQPAVSPLLWTTAQWMGLFAKEAWLGLCMGFGLASFLWAFSAAGQVVDLTYTEFGVLHFLMRRPGWVFTRNQFIDAVRDCAIRERSYAIDVKKALAPFVERLRAKYRAVEKAPVRWWLTPSAC